MLARLLVAGSGGAFTPPVVETDLIGLYNGQNGNGEYKIGAASKAIAGTWTPYGSNPVLTKGTGWEDDHVKDPCLIHDGSQFVMYYSGYDGANYRIGRATGSSYTSWTKYGSNPVLTLGSGGSFDDVYCQFPTVLYEPGDTGREWKMWYTGYDGANWGIGYAWSTDGLSFTKHGQVLAGGSSGQWDDEGCVSAAVINIGGTYFLYYGGTSRPTGDYFWQGGLATCTDPEGTYTKSANNPTLQYVNATDPAASVSLGSTASSGVTVIHPTATSSYVAGQAVVLGDTDSQTEVHTVASIDSGTQLTFEEVTASTFTSANSARLRPFDYLSVQPRTVRPSPGGYEMFATCFQPVADLAFGGSLLREGSLRYTATALDGDWTRDDTTGLMFPMYPGNTGWGQYSSENPSVIGEP